MKELLYVFMFYSSFTFGQTEWSLQQCIDSSLVNNTDIRLSQINLDGAELQQKNVIYTFLPSLNGAATHGYNWGQTIDPFTNEFATDRVQYNNFYLNSSVTLFSGLQNIYSKRIIDIELEYQSLNKDLIERNKSIEIVTAYLQASLNQEIIHISEQAVVQTEKEKKRIEEMVKEEFNTNSELLKIKAQLARDKHQLNQAKSDYSNSIFTLQQLIGLPFDSTFTLRTNPSLLEIDTINSTSIPLESQLSELNVQKQEIEIKSAKSQFLPSVSLNGSLGSGYSENNKILSPNGAYVPRPFNDQINENFYQSVSATLTVPIFNNNRNKTAVKISQLNAERIRIENERLIRVYENRILQLKQEIKNNESLLESAEIMLESTQLDLKNSELLFEQGEINAVDFLRSKNAYLNAQSELIQVKYKLTFSKVIFKLLTD